MTKDAIFSRKPNTLAVSPTFAVASGLFFETGSGKDNTCKSKGYCKRCKKQATYPNQKERERNILISPKMRLKIPLNSEFPLIFVSSCETIIF